MAIVNLLLLLLLALSFVQPLNLPLQIASNNPFLIESTEASTYVRISVIIIKGYKKVLSNPDSVTLDCNNRLNSINFEKLDSSQISVRANCWGFDGNKASESSLLAYILRYLSVYDLHVLDLLLWTKYKE